MSQKKDSKKSEISIEAVIDALKDGQVYFSWKDNYIWQFNVYKGGLFYHVRANGDGHIQSCGTHTLERLKSSIKSQITPPQSNNLEPLEGEFKKEVESKLGLTNKQYLKLFKEGEITVGGGMTTEMSFTVTASGDDAVDMDYIERVLKPTSAGYFNFNF